MFVVSWSSMRWEKRIVCRLGTEPQVAKFDRLKNSWGLEISLLEPLLQITYSSRVSILM